MKRLLFMMFLLGGMSFGFTSCGGDEDAGDAVEDTVEDVADEIGDAAEH